MEGSRIAYDNRMKLDVLENLAPSPEILILIFFFTTAGFFAICIEKNELLHACIVCNFTITNIDKCLHKVLSNGR